MGEELVKGTYSLRRWINGIAEWLNPHHRRVNIVVDHSHSFEGTTVFELNEDSFFCMTSDSDTTDINYRITFLFSDCVETIEVKLGPDHPVRLLLADVAPEIFEDPIGLEWEEEWMDLNLFDYGDEFGNMSVRRSDND